MVITRTDPSVVVPADEPTANLYCVLEPKNLLEMFGIVIYLDGCNYIQGSNIYKITDITFAHLKVAFTSRDAKPSEERVEVPIQMANKPKFVSNKNYGLFISLSGFSLLAAVQEVKVLRGRC